jgi:hypothetical protein
VRGLSVVMAFLRTKKEGPNCFVQSDSGVVVFRIGTKNESQLMEMDSTAVRECLVAWQTGLTHAGSRRIWYHGGWKYLEGLVHTHGASPPSNQHSSAVRFSKVCTISIICSEVVLCDPKHVLVNINTRMRPLQQADEAFDIDRLISGLRWP